MSRPIWFVSLLKKSFPGRFLAARVTKLPPLGRAVDRMLFEGDDLLYLPLDHTIRINQTIGNPGNLVLPSKVVESFIDQANYHWLMDVCICRDSNHCKDYPIDCGCLFLGEAVLGINPKLGKLVTKEEAHDHVQRCREAGLIHLIGRNKLDTVWLGVGPGEKLLTICNCCPCCCLWKMLPNINPVISDKVDKMPGVTVTVNDHCEGCGTCTQGICFVDAIRLVGDRAEIGEDCRGCGRCVEVCPNYAIELSVDEADYWKLTMDRITPLVDLT